MWYEYESLILLQFTKITVSQQSNIQFYLLIKNFLKIAQTHIKKFIIADLTSFNFTFNYDPYYIIYSQINIHIINMRSFISMLEEALPQKRLNPFKDGQLLMTSIPYYLLSFITLIGYVCIWKDAWLLMVIIYAILPIVDQIFSHDLRNPTEEERRQLVRDDIYFRLCLYMTMALDWAFFFKVLSYFNQFQFTFWNCYNLIALFFIFSNLNAVQFAVAHQIFHKPGLFSKLLGTIHMSKNLYMHFTYEHLFGHHRRVATPEDPASAQQGDNLYSFFPKTFFGSYKSVYQMQKKQGKPFCLNYSVLSVMSSILFIAGIYYFYSFQTTIFFILQALLSIFYLQAINYIQHYGLSRKKLSNGQYEKVTIRHSWNAPHRFSNYILFKLQRHSDHHQNSLKPYQTLVSLDQSPHLPHGYSLIIFLSFFPSSWRAVMDPLVEQYKRIGVGTARIELTQKAISLTKRFAIKLGLTVTALWAINFLRVI